MNGHSARLARLETADKGIFHIVPVFDGMTKEEAYRLRYGDKSPPPGVTCIVVYGGGTPPAGVPWDWAERRDDFQYPRWWEACRTTLPAPIREVAA